MRSRQSVTQKSLRFNGIAAEPNTQPFPKSAYVALNDIFIDFIIQNAINLIEDLRLRHPTTTAARQTLKYTPLSTRQWKRFAAHFRVATV